MNTTPQSNITKKIVVPSVAIIILLVMVAWLAGEFNNKVSPAFDESISVENQNNIDADKYVVTYANETVFENVAASITAKQTTIISSRLLARIDNINVRAGDNVTKGEVLITLEQKDLTSKVLEANEHVNAVKAKYNEAKKNYQRAKELFNKKIASQFDLDKSNANYQSLLAELTAAEQTREQSQTALSYATLRAPINGKIVDRYAEPGDTAQAGSKLLALYNPLSLRVEAQVREQLALTLSQGQQITVDLPSIKKSLTGLVEEIVPAANTGSRSFLIKISLPYQEHLLPGMYARLLIPAGNANKIYIPKNYVFQAGQLNFVNVFANKQSQRRFVRVGSSTKDNVTLIISGLNAGEQILPNQ